MSHSVLWKNQTLSNHHNHVSSLTVQQELYSTLCCEAPCATTLVINKIHWTCNQNVQQNKYMADKQALPCNKCLLIRVSSLTGVYVYQWRAVETHQSLNTALTVLSHIFQPFNPLTPMTDQDRISRYNINTISTTWVMRMKKNINSGIISWSNAKFSELTSWELYVCL